VAIDLHIHSTISDGTQTPDEIVRESLDLGLSAIALADHDAVDGVGEAIRAAEGTRLRVIPAVEINTDVGETEVHILGYFVSVEAPVLVGRLQYIRRARIERAQEMVIRLNALHLPLTMADVLAASSGDSLGRPHVARALVARGLCRTESEAFDRYLKVGRPAYVPRYRLSPADAIEMIRSAGGLPVLAHPALLRNDRLILELRDAGLVGIEAYHCEHPPPVARHYVEWARRHGLLVTGGSDAHGPGSGRPVAIGSVPVPDEVLASLEEARVQRNPR
jgi:predicted metal-dependent phosphoesterase TrpH